MQKYSFAMNIELQTLNMCQTDAPKIDIFKNWQKIPQDKFFCMVQRHFMDKDTASINAGKVGLQ